MTSSESSDSSTLHDSPKSDSPLLDEEEGFTRAVLVDDRGGIGKTHPTKHEASIELDWNSHHGEGLTHISSIRCSIDELSQRAEGGFEGFNPTNFSNSENRISEEGIEVSSSSGCATPTSSLGSEDVSNREHQTYTTQSASVATQQRQSAMHPDVLWRHVNVRKIKLRRNPLLKLLDSCSIDIATYFFNGSQGKAVRPVSSPKSRKLNAYFGGERHPQTTIRDDTEGGGAFSPNSGVTLEGIETDSNIFGENQQVQKEDTLLWCHQQINAAKSSDNGESVVKQKSGSSEYQFFHDTILADAAFTAAQFTAFGDYRDVDRVQPPEELDEILMVLTCAAKVYVAELMALAEQAELSERKQLDAQGGRCKGDTSDLLRQPSSSSTTHSDASKSKRFDSTTILLPKHIYDAAWMMKSAD